MTEATQNLDGKTPVKPVPFDAHEQATRGTHVPTSPDSPDKDPETIAEFPKAVDHVDKPGAPEGHNEPVVVKSAAEEKAFAKAKAEAEAAFAKAKAEAEAAFAKAKAEAEAEKPE